MTHEQRIERTKQELYYLIALYSLDTVDPDMCFDDSDRRLEMIGYLPIIKAIYLAIDLIDVPDEVLDDIDMIMKSCGLFDDEVTDYLDSLTEDQQKKLIEHVENYIRE